MARRSARGPTGGRGWPSLLSSGLLLLAAPLFLVAGWTVLVTWPWNVANDLGQVFSRHDVVQVADGMETGGTLLLLAAWGACWLAGLRPPKGIAPRGAVWGLVLWVPAVAALGLGAKYGLRAVLAGQGYGSRTFHVTSTGKGGGGTYVHARDGLPGACDGAGRLPGPARGVRPSRLLTLSWWPGRAGGTGGAMPALLAVPLAILAMLLILVTLPVSAPLIALLDALDRRRLGAAADGTRCLRCGHVLGQASLDAADAAWAAEMADMHRRYPGMRVHVVRRCQALCTACGAEYGWDARHRALRSLSDEPS